MAASDRFTAPYFQWLDGNGNVVVNGKLFFYVSGTTIPAVTYSNVARTVPNTWPVLANAVGRFPAIFLDIETNYDVTLKDATDRTVWSASNIATRSSIQNNTMLGRFELADGPIQELTPERVKSGLKIGIDDIGTLRSALAEKAALHHAHSIDDIDGLQTELDSILAGVLLPSVRKETLAELLADTSEADGTYALTFNDTAIVTVSRARTSNVATLVTGTHPFVAGQTVNIRLVGGTGYNKKVALASAADSTHLTYADTGGNEGTTADTAGRLDTNGIWLWQASKWNWVAASPYATQDARIATQETETADLRDTSESGVIPIKASRARGDYIFVPRAALGEDTEAVLDLADPTQYQTATTPATTGAAVVNGDDELEVTWGTDNGGAFVVWSQEEIAANRSFAVDATFDSINAALGGLAIGETATSPTLGGSLTTLPADFEMILARMNGAIEPRQRDTATAAVRLSVGASAIAYPYTTASRIRLSLVLDETGEAGVITVAADGQELQHLDVAGFTVGHRVGFCLRFSASSEVARLQGVSRSDPTFNVPVTLHVDPVAAADGAGTRSSPYNTLAQVIQRIQSDSHGRSWNVVLRGGTHVGTLDLPTDKPLELNVRSYVGERAIIKPSETLTDGWISMAADGYPRLYRREHVFGGLRGVGAASLGAGSLLQTGGVTSAAGANDTVTLPYRHLNRATINVDIATMNSAAYEGSYTMYSTGPYAGQMVVNPWGGIDPNDSVYERQLFECGIAMRFRDADSPNVSRITVECVDIQYPYLAGMLLQRCYLRLFDVTIDGVAAGEGLQTQFCYGDIDAIDVRGTVSDNWNSGGALDFDLDRKLTITCRNSQFHGATKGIWNGAPSDIAFGDCVSNHAGTKLSLTNCLMEGAAKYGGAMLDDCEFNDCTVQDCVGYGLALSPESPAGRSVTMRVRGGTIRDNLIGIVAEGVGDGTVATVIVEGNPQIEGNSDAHLKTFTATGGQAFLTCRSWSTDTLIPASGRAVESGGVLDAPAPYIVGTSLTEEELITLVTQAQTSADEIAALLADLANGPVAITSNATAALAVGANGATNPVLKVDASIASVATGIKITGAASGAGVSLAAISPASNENLNLDGKGTGGVTINGTGTGAVALGRATTVAGLLTGTSASAIALTIGPSGSSNPTLQVDSSTVAAATGLKIKAAAAAAGLALAVISSGTNDSLTIDAKGSGGVTINGTATGAIALGRPTTVAGTFTGTSNAATALTIGLAGATNPALQVDASTASSATGLKIKSAAATAGIALSVISSGTDESVTFDAKGAGTITFGATSTGNIGFGVVANKKAEVRATASGDGLRSSNSVALDATSGGVVQLTTTLTPSAADKRLGHLSIGGVTTGTTVNLSAAICGFSSEAWGGAAAGTYLTFEVTAAGATTRTEVGRWLSSGLGIGVTPSATYKLDTGATASARVGSAEVGDWRVATGSAVFGNKALDQSVNTNYALLQLVAGTTLLNAPSGQSIGLRIANVAVAQITNTGVAWTGDVSATGAMRSSGATAGVGYNTGAGGAVTQATNKSTGVTLNTACGAITMNNAALASNTSVGFTLTNSAIAATDVIPPPSIKSGATADSYHVTVDAVASGSCRISLRNISGGSLSEAVVLNFAIVKAVTS